MTNITEAKNTEKLAKTFRLIDGEEILTEPNFSIEGRWIWSPSQSRADANTMYEFVDGNAYTSYAANCGWADNFCSDADFNSLDATDRILGVHTYTFDGNTLLWDDEYSMEVLFECDGGIMLNGPTGKLWRLNSVCE